MRLPCPFCGLRDAAEFSYEGPADQVWPALDAPEAAWLDAVYLRDQPVGQVRELWRHRWGCRAWVVIERDARSHAVGRSWLAHPGAAAALAAAPGEAPAAEAAPSAPEPARPAAPQRIAAAGVGSGGGGGGGA